MEKNPVPWQKSVRIAMIKRGWSVKDLADAVCMSRVYTSAIIHERVYSEAAVKLISDALGIQCREGKNADAWGKSVRIAMVDRGWNVKDLAKAVNMSKGHTSAVINGRVYSASAVKAISDKLNIGETALSSDAD